MAGFAFDPRRALPAPPGYPEDWDPADPRTPAQREQDRVDQEFYGPIVNAWDRFKEWAGDTGGEWQKPNDLFVDDPTLPAWAREIRRKTAEAEGIPFLPPASDAPVPPPAIDENPPEPFQEPPQESVGGSGPAVVSDRAPMRPPVIQGPPKSLAYGTEIDPGFMGIGDPGVPPPQPIQRFEGPGGTGWASEDGSIKAWMGGGRPSQEDARAILARGAFNAPQAPPQQGPPQPTTVTSARFDPAKEQFVPLGPPTGAGVRESYQAVPTDPETDRQMRMQREAQDLELEKMRQAVRDPYGKERFEAEQRRGDIITRGQIERMNEQERRQAFAQAIGQIDEEAQAAISALERSQFKDKQARIDAVRQRAEAAKDNQRQAFGIGARLGSSELYKREPTY